jgi:transposase
VHATSTVWCLVDAQGDVRREGKVATTAAALTALVLELRREEERLAGQEVGTLTYLVHDALTAAGTKILSFNAHQLRVIAASRKKTDRRDAYWIAKALRSGMYPPPVYVPTGEIRELRALLSQRRILHADYQSWRYRARAYRRAAGCPAGAGIAAVRTALTRARVLTDSGLVDGIALCRRQEAALRAELQRVDTALASRVASIDAVQRLMTIPGVGVRVATAIHAWVGDVTRFPTARKPAAYAGSAPTVRQSGDGVHVGGITKQGAPALRAGLVQASHVLLARGRRPAATPLQAIGLRIRGSRGRRTIAVVALARHLLRIASYILRDGTTYDAVRLRTLTDAAYCKRRCAH